MLKIDFRYVVSDFLEALDFDVSGDDQPDAIFQPFPGSSFTQLITVTNEGEQAVTNATLLLDVSSALFESDLAAAVAENNAANGDGDDLFSLVAGEEATAQINITQIDAGETVTFALETLVPERNVAPRFVTSTTEGDSGVPNDPGSSFNEVTLFLNQDEARYTSAGSEFTFGSFDPYAPVITVSTAEAGSEQTATAQTLVPLTLEGISSTENDGFHRFLGADPIFFDADPIIGFFGLRLSDPAPFELSLFWAGPFTDTAPATPEAALVLLDSGAFGMANSEEQISKATVPSTLVVGEVGSPDFFSQSAQSGNVSNAPLETVLFQSDDLTGPSFQTFVDQLDPESRYRVLVAGDIPLAWTHYTSDFLQQIVFLEGDVGTVNNFDDRDTLDLSSILFLSDANPEDNPVDGATVEAAEIPLSLIPLEQLAIAADLGGNSQGDTVIGSTSSDSILGGNGKDTLSSAQGDDFVDGGNQDDELAGNSGNDTLLGGNGRDTLAGGADNDLLQGQNGADSLDGGTGNDTLLGGNGRDTLLGNGGDDHLAGDNGRDTLDGGTGNDTLLGGNDRDLLGGGEGNDALLGDFGNDTLLGGAGADTLTGGRDNDTLTGGSGSDVFIFAGTFGQDIVTDFSNEDTLDLSSFDLSLAEFAAAVNINGTATVIDLNGLGGGTLTLVGYVAAEVTDISVIL